MNPLTESEITKKMWESKTFEEHERWKDALEGLYKIRQRAEDHARYILKREGVKNWWNVKIIVKE